jgi:hypothetical protein
LAPATRLFTVHRYTFEIGGIFLFLHEIGDVEKCVALQAEVDECRLHPGKNPGYPTLVNGPGERVFVLPLVINLGELVVF